jgi:hypothetical protein
MINLRHGSLVVTAILAVLASCSKTINAFQAIALQSQRRGIVSPGPIARVPLQARQRASLAPLFEQLSDKDDEDQRKLRNNKQQMSRFQRLRRRLSQGVRRKLVVAAFVGAATGGFWNIATPQRADASAPVMAVPKHEAQDPATEAMTIHEQGRTKRAQEELQEYNRKAREIEASQGEGARIKFEKEYKAQKELEAKQKAEGLEKLKRDLLDQGIDPWIDFEGKRQVTLYETGLDLGQIPGTQLFLEKQWEKAGSKKSTAYKTQANRRIIKAMVQDMKNKGIDPLEYFESHQTKTENILLMPATKAGPLAQQYEANLEQYGQIDVPAEGELSVKEKMLQSGGGKKAVDAEAKKKEKEEAKRLKAEAKAKAAAEKQRAKEEAKAAKEAAKKEKAAAKAAAAAAAESAAAAASSAAESELESAASAVESAMPSSSEEAAVVGEASLADDAEQGEASAVAIPTAPSKSSKTVNIGGKEIGVVPLAGATVVAVGGGGYAFKIMQEKAAIAEEERQRQFRLLMGMDEDGKEKSESAPALEVVDEEDEDPIDVSFDEEQHKEFSSDVDSSPVETPKKKRRIGGFFSKKNKNDRETDINQMVSADATAPQFAALLARILTYGAPGRFPSVSRLTGEMPFEKFELEAAKQQLIDAREEAGISLEESAEVFAGVVNCMLIDIVDLASSTLKEKDEKVTVEGISVVVDFMNHAASLYDAVAEGVTIKPVTYGGDLGKNKLEQMYSAYAVSGMMDMANLDGDFDARVSLLQDVFQISPKKAEGLAMKAMQKNMMKMLKSGEGMEGMEDMLKSMGGAAGLGDMGMGMDGENMDPEQLKTMLLSLKEMKDSGSIPAEEFETVKSQFKEAFGSSIDDVIKEGEDNEGEFDEQDKELLDLMKSILYD